MAKESGKGSATAQKANAKAEKEGKEEPPHELRRPERAGQEGRQEEREEVLIERTSTLKPPENRARRGSRRTLHS